MMALASAAFAAVVAIVFFARREDFVRAREVDRRVYKRGVWVSGLRPLSHRQATIAAWGAIGLCAFAAGLFGAIAAEQLFG